MLSLYSRVVCPAQLEGNCSVPSFKQNKKELLTKPLFPSSATRRVNSCKWQILLFFKLKKPEIEIKKATIMTSWGEKNPNWPLPG